MSWAHELSSRARATDFGAAKVLIQMGPRGGAHDLGQELGPPIWELAMRSHKLGKV